MQLQETIPLGNSQEFRQLQLHDLIGFRIRNVVISKRMVALHSEGSMLSVPVSAAYQQQCGHAQTCDAPKKHLSQGGRRDLIVLEQSMQQRSIFYYRLTDSIDSCHFLVAESVSACLA